jgi:hypothetical protein
MKKQLIVIGLFLLAISSINCKKEDMSVKKLLTSRLWNLKSAILSGTTYSSTEMLNYAEYCGRNDVLHFNKNGTCYQMKNGCSTIYGDWDISGSESTLSLNNYYDIYDYEILSIDKYTLVIQYGGYYANGATVYLTETYSAEDPIIHGVTI